MSKYVIDKTTLTAIGDAVRAKGNTEDKILVSDLATAITNLPTGGGGGDLPEEAFTITGNCEYRFANDGWTWFINKYGNRITTKDITTAKSMFDFCRSLEHLPFDLNFKSGTDIDVGNIFSYCDKLKQVPQFISFRPQALAHIFANCQHIREYPENYGADWDWSYMESQTSQYTGSASHMVDSNYSLRKLPMELYKHVNPYATYSYSIYNGMICSCYSLDEAVNIPVPYIYTAWTSNAFSGSAFHQTCRLKNFTFSTNDDGTPIAVKWKSQTIDLSSGVGYATFAHTIYSYNSGITVDKLVKDDATYQALKNDPDWFTVYENYSRYNHDSAVETINSLPDTSAYLASAGGTNTIKFKGASGALTDGGAINTLTAEEIAVATAKGWTVSLS